MLNNLKHWSLCLGLALVACKKGPKVPDLHSEPVPGKDASADQGKSKTPAEETPSTQGEGDKPGSSVPPEENPQPGEPNPDETKTEEPKPEEPKPEEPKPEEPKPEAPKPKPVNAYRDRRIDELTFLTSHNAFVNRDDTFWFAPNQGMSLKKQLEAGVSALMLDVHSYNGAVTLCHGKCNGVPGITPRQDFLKAMNEVAAYLKSKPEAFITIFLEDYTSNGEMRAALEKTSARDFLFNPYAAEVTKKGWPTINDLINSGKRLMIISDRDDKKDLGIGFAKDLTAENYWSTGLTGKDLECRSRWDEMPLDRTDSGFHRLFVMNHFRDIPVELTTRSDNSQNFLWDRMEQKCLTASRRKPNFLALDFVETPDDAPRKIVNDLNKVGAIIYKDSEFSGGGQILKAGRYNIGDLKVGNDIVSSVRVYRGYRVLLFKDPEFRTPFKELTEDSRLLEGEGNDVLSSIIVEEIK